METLISYKGDKTLKVKFVAEIEKHRKMDAIVQGTYGKENGQWSGCAVACSLRSLAILDGEELKTKYETHKDYETKLGIPEWLARLEDTIFEGLPVEDAKKWPGLFAKTIPVGVSLEPVKWKFCSFVLKESIERVLTLDIQDDLKEQVVKSIQGVLALHETAIKTGKWDKSAESAESAAWSAESAASAAASAAWSAAWSAESAAWSAASAASAESAASAAWSAESAESAAWSAASAAWSAESAASAAWSAESAAYQKYAKHLLKLLKEAE